MIFFGHIGITIFLAALLFLPVSYAFIGALLPDIVDKALFEMKIGDCGRFIAHSVFFAPVVGLIVYAITRKKMAGLAIMFGSYIHLLEDMTHSIPWFFPVVNYNFICMPIESIRLGVFEIVTESIGLVLLILVIVFKDKIMLLRERIWSKIRGKL